MSYMYVQDSRSECMCPLLDSNRNTEGGTTVLFISALQVSIRGASSELDNSLLSQATCVAMQSHADFLLYITLQPKRNTFRPATLRTNACRGISNWSVITLVYYSLTNQLRLKFCSSIFHENSSQTCAHSTAFPTIQSLSECTYFPERLTCTGPPLIGNWRSAVSLYPPNLSLRESSVQSANT